MLHTITNNLTFAADTDCTKNLKYAHNWQEFNQSSIHGVTTELRHTKTPDQNIFEHYQLC